MNGTPLKLEASMADNRYGDSDQEEVDAAGPAACRAGKAPLSTMFVKTELCRYYSARKSMCHKGEACPFAHGKAELRTRPDLTKTAFCRLFSRSKCPRGNACPFAHGQAELRDTPQSKSGMRCPQCDNVVRDTVATFCAFCGCPLLDASSSVTASTSASATESQPVAVGGRRRARRRTGPGSPLLPDNLAAQITAEAAQIHVQMAQMAHLSVLGATALPPWVPGLPPAFVAMPMRPPLPVPPSYYGLEETCGIPPWAWPLQ
mmetsp:Transcript_66766/g.147977  ORF Transcript_66766/g.147977 Transcript_66766/m.147977 type:complete len:261 (-) Transcript_66766:51-833(-)